MTPPAPTPAPTTIRALWPVGAVRVALALVSVIGSAAVLPGIWRDSQDHLAARTGSEALPGFGDSFGVLIAILTAGYGLAFLGGWVFAARAALRGRKWGAVLLAVLSGYGVVTGLLSLAISSFNRVIARVVPDGYSYSLPDWLLVVAGVFAAVDLLVVVLLLLPPSRAWIRELNPPRTAAAPQPPTSWPPPTGPFDRRH